MELLDRENLAYRLTKSERISRYFQQIKQRISCCELCHGEQLIHPLLCRYCCADLPYFQLAQCQYDLLNWPAIDKLFAKRKFDRLLVLTPYLWPIDGLLKQLKYHNRFELADLFGFLLSQLWQQLPDNDIATCLCSVPIHLSKWQIRGYNQAHLIAKSLAKYLQLDYRPDALLRTKDLPSQVGQSGKARRRNIKQAFHLNADSQTLPDHVILLDDVITTGTTVNAICSLLKHQGVEHITVLTVALSLP